MSDESRARRLQRAVRLRRSFVAARCFVIAAFVAAAVCVVVVSITSESPLTLLGLIPIALLIYRQVWWLQRSLRWLKQTADKT